MTTRNSYTDSIYQRRNKTDTHNSARWQSNMVGW